MKQNQPSLFDPPTVKDSLDDDPAIWNEFKDLALQMIGRGIKRYGAKAIMEVIRFHRAVRSNDPCFKVNNNLTSYYARRFHREFPQYDGFFETRKSRLDWPDERSD